MTGLLPNHLAAPAARRHAGSYLFPSPPHDTVVYNNTEDYGGVKVKKGQERVRLLVKGEKFDTVMVRRRRGSLGVTFQGVHVLSSVCAVRRAPLMSCLLPSLPHPQAAIGSHPGTMEVTLEIQKCKPLTPDQQAAVARMPQRPMW